LRRNRFIFLPVLILVSFLLVVCAASGTAWAESEIDVDRIQGGNRYLTAVEISKTGWTESKDVILARGDNYADALTGVPLAHKLNAPILLTPSSNLNNDTLSEIKRLGAERVIILGGTNAISVRVENALRNEGLDTERISGGNRFDTAAKIAEHVAPDGASTAVIAYGLNFPDALAAAPYAAKAGYPILLVDKTRVPQETLKAIGQLGVSSTIVVGGKLVIDEKVLNQLPSPKRVNGSNRFATAVELAKYFDPGNTHMYIATGSQFADAITGAVLVAKNNSGVLLVGNSVHPEVKNYIKEYNIEKLTVFGGYLAVSEAVVDQLQNRSVPTELNPSEIAAIAGPAVGTIYVYDGFEQKIGNGSAFLVDANGKLVTNYHVIDGAYSAQVRFSNGSIYDVQKVLAYDVERDIAVLKIAGSSLPYLNLGNSDSIVAGQRVVAIGSPLGYENTITEGLVSNVNRVIEGQSYIQTSASISPGSSGGPLLDLKANVIGITTSGYDGQNLNFAIPINEVKGYLSQNLDLTLEQVVLRETEPVEPVPDDNIIYESEPNDGYYVNCLPLGFYAMAELTPYDIDVFEVYVPAYGYLFVGGGASSPSTDLGILVYDEYEEILFLIDYQEDDETQSHVYFVYPGYYYLHVFDANIGGYGRYYLVFADMLEGHGDRYVVPPNRTDVKQDTSHAQHVWGVLHMRQAY
jgi:serine protease Do